MKAHELIRAALEEAATFFRTMADYSGMDDGQALVNMLEKYSPCADPYKAARAHLQAAAKQLDVESELAQVLGVLGTMPEFTIAPKGADKRHHYLRYLGAALDLEKQHGADLRALALRLEARQLLVPKVDTTGWLGHKKASEMLCDYLSDDDEMIWSESTCGKEITNRANTGEIESFGPKGKTRLYNPASIERLADKVRREKNSST